MCDVIDLGLESLLGKILVVFRLITVVFFPSLALGCSLNGLFYPGRGSFTSFEMLLGPIKDTHFVVIGYRWLTLISDPRIKGRHVLIVVHILRKVTLSLCIITVRENIGHLQFKL